MGIVNKNTSARGHPILRRYRKHFKILRIFPSIVRYQVLRGLVRNMDPEGFDPVADTVGAGIYGGQIKYSADGKPEIKGPQYGDTTLFLDQCTQEPVTQTSLQQYPLGT